MRPTGSIIAFTVASGAGFGLLALLLSAHLAGLVGDDIGLLGAGFGLAYLLISGGLIASTFHLGHPERMLLALSQWRSSWLSREALLALASYPLGLAYLGWAAAGAHDGGLIALGVATLGVSLGTVFCTAMIYASLRPIFAWHSPIVPACYLAFALMTGALVFLFLAQAMGSGAAVTLFWLALGFLLIGLALKRAAWHRLDRGDGGGSAESATGLGRFGRVRQFEAPSTGQSYITHEMGFEIARRHARALRRAALAFGFLAPLGLLILGALLAPPGPQILDALAVISCAFGITLERWLFFAEAQHAAMLYYGATRA